jgi:hypothetical protein
MSSFAQYGPGKEEFPVNASRGILRRNTANDGWEEKTPENILNDAVGDIDINGQKIVNVGSPTPGTSDVATTSYADSVGVDSINLAAYNLLATGLATGVNQPLSLADSVFTGQVIGGSTSGGGTLGVIGASFANVGAETGVGVGQGGFGNAPALDQPYNLTDFPGQHVECGLIRADGAAVSLSDLVAAPPPGQGGQEIESYITYRSDLGVNLKWRLWFYYRRTADGFHVSFTPDISIQIDLYVPIVAKLADLPVGFGLGQISATPGAAGVIAGIAADIQPVGTVVAAGTSGRFSDAQHVHIHDTQTVDTLHALAVAGVSHGFLDKADKTKLDALPANSVPTTRTVIAGAGLTGGGDLSANRGFDVVANADGSIVVNADDIQVGVITGTQHGTQLGGTLHADATQIAAGFMSALDKAKLDAVAGDTFNVTHQTANAAVTDVPIYTPADGKEVTIQFTASVRRIDGTVGASYRIFGGFKRAGGTTTQIGVTKVIAFVQDPGFAVDVTMSVSGTTVNARITGILATTIDWRMQGGVVIAP